jgi:sugar phosphate isomerase/epimerase
MSWSTSHSTWQDVVHLAQLVDRANFKICLDTFHLATKLWASPHDPSGKYPDADPRLAEDLRTFIIDFPLEKLAYVQLSDAERLNPPMSKQHPWYVEGEASEFSWSKHGRPFPLEKAHGGYLPMVEIVRTWIVEKGFRGYVSMETFDRRTRDEGATCEECAARAERSWARLERALDEPSSLL